MRSLEELMTVPSTQWTAPERKLVAKSHRAAPENGNGKVAAKGKGFSLVGYVRCDLAAADKESFKAWETATAPEVWMLTLVAMADSGYVVKFGEADQGCQASASAASTGREWDGYVLTAHASSAHRAAMLLVFKHEVLMQRDWSMWVSGESEDFLR